jgi:hypothetical protein
VALLLLLYCILNIIGRSGLRHWHSRQNGLSTLPVICGPHRRPMSKDSGRATQGNRGLRQAGGKVIVDWFYDAAVSGADAIARCVDFKARALGPVAPV